MRERLDGEAPKRVAVAPIAAEARRTLRRGRSSRAIELAARNITRLPRGSLPAEHAVETMPGLTVRKVWRPIDRVGLYVPGGKTPLFSTLLMLAHSRRAPPGVREIVVVTPPRPEGGLDPLVALAAELCGIEAIWTVGGAQAIARSGLRRRRHPRVAKICGPGNAWVAEAKTLCRLAARRAGDRHAGRAERIAGHRRRRAPIRDLVAADLLSQAEHDAVGAGAAGHPVGGHSPTRSQRAVERSWPRPAARATSPRRRSAMRALILADDLDAGGRDRQCSTRPSIFRWRSPIPMRWSPLVRNAGAVFAGHARRRDVRRLSRRARATSCPPTAPPAPGAASRSTPSSRRSASRRSRREAARAHRRARPPRWPGWKG